MSGIRSSNTKFEQLFISKLKQLTEVPFTINEKRIKGKPDIVFAKQKICVFLDSDFWHGWQYPKWKNKLKNNFWKRKIEYNRNRDKRITAYLRKTGWKVIRIWGHQLFTNYKSMLNKVTSAL